jgi:hypothetical protein
MSQRDRYIMLPRRSPFDSTSKQIETFGAAECTCQPTVPPSRLDGRDSSHERAQGPQLLLLEQITRRALQSRQYGDEFALPVRSGFGKDGLELIARCIAGNSQRLSSLLRAYSLSDD